MRPPRMLLLGTLLVGWMSVWCSPARALVVENMTGTTVPPADDPGWANFTIGGDVSRNYVYLGDGWALSARHVGPGPGAPDQTLQFASGSFDIIPGQNYVVQNPAQVMNSSGQMINLSTPTGGLETDLRLVRLNGDPGLPSISIAEQSTPLGGEVLFIGHGRTREASHTHWNVTGNPPTWNEVSSGGNHHGYKSLAPNDDTKRWGKNNIANANDIHSDDGFYEILSSTTGVMQLETADEKTRNVISLSTSFNMPGSGVPDQEAQGVDKDSGTAVFYKRGGNWELTGIVHAIVLPLENQPSFTAVYGNATTFTDLSYYYHSNPADDYPFSISDIIRDNPNYSVIGDVNLDGEVTGDGTGSAETDDVTAFVAGWGYNMGVADITSWKNGDLSGPTGLRDGKTDVYDFLALRNALPDPGAGASLAALLGISVVPEPSAALLTLIVASFLMASWRHRRRPGC